MEMMVSGLAVEVTRKRIKNMYLRLSRNGDIVVSAPARVPRSEIERFVSEHLPWIERHRDDARMSAPQPRSCATGEPLWVWGQKLTLHVIPSSSYDLSLADGVAYLTVPGTSDRDRRCAWLREWYRSELKREARDLVPMWEERTGLRCSEWRTKWMTSRWGTCNTQAKRLWLNVQLAKHPRESLDYVVLHEVAHLKVPNHGPEFQALLTAHMPDWRSRRRELNARRFELTE